MATYFFHSFNATYTEAVVQEERKAVKQQYMYESSSY